MDSMDQVGPLTQQMSQHQMGLFFAPDFLYTRFFEPGFLCTRFSLNQVRNLMSPRVIKTHLSIDMLPKQVHLTKQIDIYSFRNYIVFHMYNIKCKGVAEESESNICDKEPQRCCGKNCWIMHKSLIYFTTLMRAFKT